MYFLFLLGLIGDFIIIVVFKMLVQRERLSFNKLDMFVIVFVDNYFFFLGYCFRVIMFVYFFLERVNFEVLIFGFIVLWVFLVLLFRFFFGRYYLSDVLFGMIFGVLEFKFLLYYWLSKENCMFVLELFFVYFYLQIVKDLFNVSCDLYMYRY